MQIWRACESMSVECKKWENKPTGNVIRTGQRYKIQKDIWEMAQMQWIGQAFDFIGTAHIIFRMNICLSSIKPNMRKCVSQSKLFDQLLWNTLAKSYFCSFYTSIFRKNTISVSEFFSFVRPFSVIHCFWLLYVFLVCSFHCSTQRGTQSLYRTRNISMRHSSNS